MQEITLINSLDEALSFIGRRCDSCIEIGQYGVYENTTKKDGFLIFLCNRGTGHEFQTEILFEPSEVQIREIAQESIKNGKRFESLNKKLELAVRLLPEHVTFQVNGRCNTCYDLALLKIKDRRILYDCNTCRRTGQENNDTNMAGYD